MLQERFIHSGKLENRNVNWSLVLLLQFLQLLKINTKNDDSSISSFCSDLLGYLRMHLTIPGTSWTSRSDGGRPDLTSWGGLSEVDSGRLQDVLRTSPTRPWKHVSGSMWGHLLYVPKFLFTFLSELIRLIKSI